MPDYARAALFDPLDLGPTEWINNRDTWVAASYGPGDGEPVAASGLRMTPRDLARIGQLVLNKGAVDGRQVLPAQWLTECLTPRVSVDEQRRYGYNGTSAILSMAPRKGRVSIVGSVVSVMADNGCSSCPSSILWWPSPPEITVRRISGGRRLRRARSRAGEHQIGHDRELFASALRHPSVTPQRTKFRRQCQLGNMARGTLRLSTRSLRPRVIQPLQRTGLTRYDGTS